MRIKNTLMSMIALFFVVLVTTSSAIAQGAVSQEVFDSDTVPVGTVVSLTDGDLRQVSLANIKNSEYLFGVVTIPGSTLAEIGTADEGRPVANAGDVSVVVSTINGDISEGDILGVSAISGVAALADTRQTSTVLGVASGDFSANSPGARAVTTTLENGETSTATIGTIVVRLAINDFYVQTTEDDSLLRSFGERFVGREVSTTQAIFAAAIVLASIIVGGMMMWNSVRGGFISIGRNPLAGNAVFNGLYYVTIISLGIVTGGFVAGYVILLL